MKKLFCLFYFFISSIAFGANVYFDSPENGQTYTLDSNGRAGMSYHIHMVSLYFTTDWYGARVQYPDGHWGAWQNGQSGGWVFTQAGTYHIEGCVHVVRDFAGRTDYYMYSNILTFYVVAPPPPPPPLSGVSISGDFTLYAEMTGHWVANLQDGIEPFSYSWEIMYVGGSEPLASSEVDKKDKDKKNKDKGPGIEAAPSDDWVPVGSNSPYFSKSHNPYDLRDFYLRCTVTDGSSTTKTSSAFFVDVVSYPPGQGNIVQADNPDTTPIAQSMSLKTQNVDAIMVEESIPNSFSLEQNYPNPFNPTTNISYTITESGFVSLKVYNMLGKEVAILVNESKPSGSFNVEFNAENLPSGTYLYRISVGNYSDVKKMILIK